MNFKEVLKQQAFERLNRSKQGKTIVSVLSMWEEEDNWLPDFTLSLPGQMREYSRVRWERIYS